MHSSDSSDSRIHARPSIASRCDGRISFLSMLRKVTSALAERLGINNPKHSPCVAQCSLFPFAQQLRGSFPGRSPRAGLSWRKLGADGFPQSAIPAFLSAAKHRNPFRPKYPELIHGTNPRPPHSSEVNWRAFADQLTNRIRSWHSSDFTARPEPVRSTASRRGRFVFAMPFEKRYWLLRPGEWRPVGTVLNSDTISCLPPGGETRVSISTEISGAHSRKERRLVHTSTNNWRAFAGQLANRIQRCHSSDFTRGPSHCEFVGRVRLSGDRLPVLLIPLACGQWYNAGQFGIQFGEYK